MDTGLHPLNVHHSGEQEDSVILVTDTIALIDVDTTPCRENDAELWFAESTYEVERAKALCGPCPLRAACLAGAIERAEPWGVWGGEVFIGGVIVATKRGRGRPRKDDSCDAGELGEAESSAA